MRVAGLLAAAALCAAAAPAAPRLKPAEEAAIVRAAERGALLFDIDRAAWVTTDDLFDQLHANREVPIKGWVVEREGSVPGAYVVTYYIDGPSGLVAWYVGHVRDNAVVSSILLPEGERPALTPAQARMARAIQVAGERKGLLRCTDSRFNVEAIPPAAADAPIDVYVLSAMTETDVYPFGGHHLVRVGADGKVLSSRAFTKSCVNISSRGTDKEDMAAFSITHILDPVPTEIHVFLSLWSRKPIAVGTRTGVWWVAGNKITRPE